MCCSLLAAFRICFPLSLVFKNVVIMCLHVHFLGFNLFGFFSAFWAYRFMSFVKFGKFQPLLLQIVFSPAIFLSFGDSSDTYVVFSVIVLEALFFFPPSLFSLCYLDCVNSISCSFILPSVISTVLLSPSGDIFISVCLEKHYFT